MAQSTASWHTVLRHAARSTASRHTVPHYGSTVYIHVALTRTSTALWQTQYYAKVKTVCNAYATNSDTDHCVGGEPPLGGVV